MGERVWTLYLACPELCRSATDAGRVAGYQHVLLQQLRAATQVSGVAAPRTRPSCMGTTPLGLHPPQHAALPLPS